MTKTTSTKAFILEKVRVLFNRNGYSGTSLSDITKATGLTKGAIYGNFENKEDLALASFNYSVTFILKNITSIIDNIQSPIARLYAIINFYRDYYNKNIDFGGCPILNVGIDAHYTNPKLFKQVKIVFVQVRDSLEGIIIDGQNHHEIKTDIDAKLYATRILSQIEGAFFTSILLDSNIPLTDMTNHLDIMIKTELQK